jgi:hypothetical protein
MSCSCLLLQNFSEVRNKTKKFWSHCCFLLQKNLVSLLFSVAEEFGLTDVFCCRRIWSHCCFLLQKNLVSLLFSVAEEFDLTAVFCLQSFVEVQYKTRKALEAVVEKRNKQFTEWKASQAKAKSK